MTQNIHTVEQAFRLAKKYLREGKIFEAEQLYAIVVSKFPQNKKAKKLLKTLQASKNRVPEPSHQEVTRLVGYYSSGKLTEAYKYASELFKIYPENARLNLSFGAVQADLGMIENAISSYERCLRIDPNYADAHNNLGNIFIDLHNYEEAIKCLCRSLELVPGDVEVLCNLGNVYLEIGDWNNATLVFERAVDIQPDCVQAQVCLGSANYGLDEIEKANICMARGRELKSQSVETYQVVSSFYEASNQIEELRETIAEAKAFCKGGLDKLAFAEAVLLQIDGDIQGALALAGSVCDLSQTNSFLQARSVFLGKLYDRLGNFAEAFSAFEDGNQRSMIYAKTNGIDSLELISDIENLQKCYSSEWVSSWGAADCNYERVDPVFLVGFPRSGTTLLDTILRSHHLVSVVEEQPAVEKIVTRLSSLQLGYPMALEKLDSDQIEMLRNVYFSELDKYLESNEKDNPIIVDKLPLNIFHVGAIHRIFPNSKFIFAQRHPCDCVLSCFMQNFKLNSAMANFLDLNDAAYLYDKTMNLWLQYHSVMSLQVHTVVYEDVVGSFEETLRPLFDFLGVGWDDNVNDYATTAISRGRIATPSYNQVIQPIYKRASGRWEKYREQMSPVLPTLLPWARQMGYNE